jgi:hypothetical protein
MTVMKSKQKIPFASLIKPSILQVSNENRELKKTQTQLSNEIENIDTKNIKELQLFVIKTGEELGKIQKLSPRYDYLLKKAHSMNNKAI